VWCVVVWSLCVAVEPLEMLFGMWIPVGSKESYYMGAWQKVVLFDPDLSTVDILSFLH